MEEVEVGAMPWYRSTVIVSALISLVTKVLVISGLISELSPEDMDILTNTIVLIAGGIADLVALKSRVVQKQAPQITSTKKKAAAITNPAPVMIAGKELPQAKDVMIDVNNFVEDDKLG